MKRSFVCSRVLPILLMAAAGSPAAVLLDINSALAVTDPTQLGRLSRNAVAQDWVDSEPFPGIVNPSTVYHYTTYSVNVGVNSYIQIVFDSVSSSTFASAYDTAYLPDSSAGANRGFDTNWLGDAGSSGNYFGTDPIFFQVFVPASHNLIVVVNNTAAGTGGLGDPFHLTVEGFIDSSFDDAPVTRATPEPSTTFLIGSGLAGLVLASRSRSRR